MCKNHIFSFSGFQVPSLFPDLLSTNTLFSFLSPVHSAHAHRKHNRVTKKRDVNIFMYVVAVDSKLWRFCTLLMGRFK